MNQVTAQHQIGEFVVLFQHAETALTELIVLMVSADEEAIRILVNELDYRKRVETTRVLFSWFVRTRSLPEELDLGFKKFAEALLKVGELRNAIVHSKYSHWINVEGKHGLIREQSKLRPSAGTRQVEAHDLLPSSFLEDLQKVSELLRELERFRLIVIDALYPIN